MGGEEDMTTNKERANRVASLLSHEGTDTAETLIDVLADAMHWCERNDIDFDRLLNMASMHFNTERNEEAADEQE
jgi:hypothetical protein